MHTRPRFSPRRASGGFSLIEMLLSLGIVLLISGLVLTGLRRDNESAQAKAVGQQMQMVGTALNTYISMRYDVIAAAVPGTGDVGSPGTAADPGPRTCVNATIGGSAGKICTITSDTLRRNSLVPNSFSGINAYGASYLYEIHVTGSSPNWVIDGMVATNAPYTTGSTVRYDLLGQSMLAAGTDSGMTRTTANLAEGYNGSWAENTYTNLTALGQLAYRAGYSSQGYAAYLRRDGSAAMTGDLNLGSHNITGVAAINASGQITAGTEVLTASDPSGNNANALAFGPAASPRATIGTYGLGGAEELRIRHANGVRIEDLSGGAGVLDVGNVNGTNLNAITAIVSQGTLSSTGNGSIGGTLTVGNPGSAPAAGGLTANGAIASLSSITGTTLYAGSGTTASLVLPGAVYFNNTASPTGLVYNSATSTISMAQNPNLYTGADIRSLTGHVDTTLQVGGGIVFDGSQNPAVGAACSTTHGLMANSTSGTLVQCSNGLWTSMGLAPNATVEVLSPSPVCTTALGDASPAVATCPAGYQISGGGYNIASGAPRAAPISSYRNGNTWLVYAGTTDPFGTGATTVSCWTARAVCAR